MPTTFHWHDTDVIARQLADRHPEEDPAEVTLSDLQRLVEELDGFEEKYGHPCNDDILEAIHGLWVREYEEGVDIQDAYEAPDEAS
jgi:FeS assembly protein IscX